jgi:hypothetical protein
MEIADDPRFSELSPWIQAVLQDLPPTGYQGKYIWHEVGFRLGKVLFQATVLDQKWIALDPPDVERLWLITYILNEEGQVISICRCKKFPNCTFHPKNCDL